jgi:cation transport regulator ChaB
MPYSSTQELPKPVRDRYSSKCQRAFLHAFNSTHEKTGDEGRAMASGHAAAKRCEGKAMDDIVTAEAVPSARFDIFTGILKAGGGDGEPMTLSGIASSSVEDLHGDRIERSALKDMEAQIANGLAIFLNHSYKVPEDLAGYADAAKITKRGEDAEGNAIWDLDLSFTINDENPRAVEAWRGINKKKAKVGLSIGANIPPGGYEIDRKTGAKTIKRITLLETSIVGIPANPRSWIAKALESIEEKEPVEALPPITAPSGTWSVPTVWTTTSSTDIVLTPEELAAAPPADDREPETSPDQPGVSADSAPEAPEATPAPEEGQPTEPSEVASLESDTDIAAAMESLSQAEGAVDLTHLQMAVDLGRALAEQLVIVRKERDDAVEAKAEAERDRDETITRTGQILAQTAEIVEAVGKMPLGRKAVIREQSAKLKHLESTYGTEFMKMLG